MDKLEKEISAMFKDIIDIQKNLINKQSELIWLLMVTESQIRRQNK